MKKFITVYMLYGTKKPGRVWVGWEKATIGLTASLFSSLVNQKGGGGAWVRQVSTSCFPLPHIPCYFKILSNVSLYRQSLFYQVSSNPPPPPLT